MANLAARAMKRGTRPPRPPATPLRAFLSTLWQQPIWAIPFAVFFGTIFGRGGGLDAYLSAYLISLVFAYSIGIAMWVAQYVIQPRVLPKDWDTRGGAFLKHVALFMGTSVIGAMFAALVIHFTIFPGFLGSARSVAVLGMFTLIFTLLFSGIAYSISFYRSAIDKARAEQELHLARRIQRSFLLSQFPTMPRLEVHAVNVSSKEVSGDFYDVVPSGDRAFLLAIADVAGKGVPAALLSSMLQASLRTQAGGGAPVSTILENINALVYRSTTVQQFATFFLARVEEDRLRLTFTNAGHNFPFVFSRDGRTISLEKGGTVVGILENVRYEEASVDLAPGDRVVLYTDGISEAAAPSGELFGEERLCELVRSLPPDLGAPQVIERVLADVREYTAGAEPADDMTVMVLRVIEPETPIGSRTPSARA